MNSATLLHLLAPIGALGSGLVAGVFFVFSVCVMRALSFLAAPEGIRAMQNINRVILNPLFLAVFLTTGLCALGATITGALHFSLHGGRLMLAAGLLYGLGTFIVTVVFNVPLNDLLAKADPDSSAAAAIWAKYLQTWTAWNHVRTVAAVLTACAFIAACGVNLE